MVSSIYKWLTMAGFYLMIFAGPGFSPIMPKKLADPINHPLYISVTEMEFNEKDKVLEISSKVFTDDLEKALSKATGTIVDMYHPKDKALVEKQIAAYLNSHLQIKLDNKPLALEFVGFELEEQSTWSYYQVSKLAGPPKKVEIFSNIFYEMNDKQINIFHFAIGANRKSTKLDYPSTVAIFDF